MMLSNRQICLLVLLLVIVPAAATSVTQFSLISEGGLLAQDALITLVSGALHGHDLLFVTDDHNQSLLDVGRVMAAADASQMAVLLATQHSLLHTAHPAHHTQGSLLTAILLFHHDPTAFLYHLAGNKHWNPSYLVLFCLDSHLNSTTILTQPVVQRSRFILLLQPAAKASQPRLLAYTSRPIKTSDQREHYTMTLLGAWSSDIYQNRHSLFPSRFEDFGGQVLEVTVMCYDEPFMYFDKNGRCIGGNRDGLELIADKHNFRISIVLLDVIVWGVKENGTWKGMFGELMYRGKQFMISSQNINLDAVNDFDWTYPYRDNGFAIILKVPPPLPQWQNILYPFSKLMWGLVFATMLTVASLLSIILLCLHHTTDPVGITLKVAGGLFNQPMESKVLRLWWARVWLVFWWLAVDILAVVYTGSLVSVLTVPVYPVRINTIEELAASDIIPSMSDYGSFVPDALRTSKNPTLATLGRKLFLDPELVREDPYGGLLRRVLAGKHGLIVSIDYLTFTQHKKKLTRSTYIMEEKLYNTHMSWFMPRHTPYSPIISRHLIRLLETGILSKIYQIHRGTLIGQDSQVRGDGVLNLGQLQGAFIVLALGLVAAPLTLMLECLD